MLIAPSPITPLVKAAIAVIKVVATTYLLQLLM